MDQEVSTQAGARVPQFGQVLRAMVLAGVAEAAAVAATAVIAAIAAIVAEAADWRYRGEDLEHSAASERVQTEVEVGARTEVPQVIPCPAGRNLVEEGMERDRAHLVGLEGMAGHQAGSLALGTRGEDHCI